VTPDWKAPTGIEIFNDSGTYAPTYMVGPYEQDGERHVFLLDGYAASAEAMQAASLSEAFDLDVSMALFSSQFKLPYGRERQVMLLDPEAPDFAARLEELCGEPMTAERVEAYRFDIRDALASNVPAGQRTFRIDDLFPEKRWRGQATAGYMCTDPYTGAPGVEDLGDGRYRVTSRLATRRTSVRCTFTVRLMKGFEESRLVFSPLLIRHTNPGSDFRDRPVKVSDSGRIRNELQTMLFQALEYQGGQKIRVHFDRIDEKMLSPERKALLWDVLRWYQNSHPVWFHWLEIL
jgi:hypothetical protein